MGRGRFRKRWVVTVALWLLASVFVAPFEASARDSDSMRRANDRSQEIARQQQERERERQERERERQERERERQQREQARQARERARQERDQARQEREQARQERQQAKREPEEKSKPNQPAPTAQGKDDNDAQDEAKAAGTMDPKAAAVADKAKAERAKSKIDPIDDDDAPTTVVEWFKGILKPAPPAAPPVVAAPALRPTGPVVVTIPAAKPARPVAVAAPASKPAVPATAPVTGVSAAGVNKSGTSKPITTTGSTPPGKPAAAAVQAAAPPASPAAAAKGQKPAAGRPVGRDTLPAFPSRAPEVLASNLSAKSIDRAVALGFQLNGTSRVARADLNVTRLVAPSGMSADQAQELLSRDMPGGLFGVNHTYRIYRTATATAAPVQPDNVRAASPMATPCGTDRCFGPSIMHWQSSLQVCSKGVKIGVIDTGYDVSHPAFTTKVIESRRSAASDRAKSPDWHGTGVLALLAGDANSGTPGLIPEAKFYVADIFYADAEGLPSSDTASLLNALDWLDKRNVNVINMSLSGPPDDLLKAAIEGLSNKKVIFVAAAGNDGPTAPPSYPAAYSSVVAVTAVSRDKKSYRYASRGDHIDVAAPGVDIWTASPGGRGAYHSGTSFAVPYVTAVLATAYKGLAAKNKAEFLRKASVLDLGEPGRDPVYGRGLLLAPAACATEPDVVASAPIVTSATPVKGQMGLPLGLTTQAKPR